MRIDDIKIIYNDWPYGIDKSIVHLCVWTKFPLDVDENDPNGDLTPEMRAKIDKYVDKTFGSRVPAENVSLFPLPFLSFPSTFPFLSPTTNNTLYLPASLLLRLSRLLYCRSFVIRNILKRLHRTDPLLLTRPGPKKIIWFKNWAKLKSIHSMEHFHVMMKDPDMEFIKEITKGDQPVSAQFPEGEILE